MLVAVLVHGNRYPERDGQQGSANLKPATGPQKKKAKEVESGHQIAAGTRPFRQEELPCPALLFVSDVRLRMTATKKYHPPPNATRFFAHVSLPQLPPSAGCSRGWAFSSLSLYCLTNELTKTPRAFAKSQTHSPTSRIFCSLGFFLVTFGAFLGKGSSKTP
jgi:hypothetical protein